MHVKLLPSEAFFQPKMKKYRWAAGLRVDPLEELRVLPPNPGQQVQLLGPDFGNGMVKKVKLHQRAKFRGDRSVTETWRFFKMAAAAILDF